MTIETAPVRAVRHAITITRKTTTSCMLDDDDNDHCPPTYLVSDTTLRSHHTDYSTHRPHWRETPLSSNHICRLSIMLSATAPMHVICHSSSFVPMFWFSPSHWTHVSSPCSTAFLDTPPACPFPSLLIPFCLPHDCLMVATRLCIYIP
jgi:hypothetical protein